MGVASSGLRVTGVRSLAPSLAADLHTAQRNSHGTRPPPSGVGGLGIPIGRSRTKSLWESIGNGVGTAWEFRSGIPIGNCVFSVIVSIYTTDAV